MRQADGDRQNKDKVVIRKTETGKSRESQDREEHTSIGIDLTKPGIPYRMVILCSEPD